MRRLARRLFTFCPALLLGLCLAACVPGGCMPLRQQDVTGGQSYDHFLYHDHGRYGLLQIGPSNVPKRVNVVDAESYALAPNGSRYRVVTQPHGYDLDTTGDGAPYVRDRVYLVGANGRRSRRSWADGRWEFVFALDTPDGRDSRRFVVDLGTFNYNPLVHGPPN